MNNQIRIVPVVVLAGLVGLGGVAIFFFASDPQDVKDFFAQRPTMPQWEWPKKAPAPPAPYVPPPDVYARRQPAECLAMTWRVRYHLGMGTAVGYVPTVSDAIHGDTPCGESRALLCFKRDLHPPPEGYNVGYGHWTGGLINLIPDVRGVELTSREVADARCATKFGEGWRMAEFHDANTEYGYGAWGELPSDSIFWVAINDQRANPWN